MPSRSAKPTASQSKAPIGLGAGRIVSDSSSAPLPNTQPPDTQPRHTQPPCTQGARGELGELFDRYLTQFAGHLPEEATERGQGKSENQAHTSRAKRYDLSKFEDFLIDHTGRKASSLGLSHLSHATISAFLESLLHKGESPATVSRRLATIKHFCRLLSEERRDFINPARAVKAPRTDAIKPKGLSSDELGSVGKRLSERVSQRPVFSRMRDAMLVQLLVETGLRADEVRLLRKRQLERNLTRISNVRTKGKRFRSVYIPSTAREPLAQYLTAREKELRRFFTILPNHLNEELPLFISTYRIRAESPDSFLLAPKTVWRAVRAASVDTKLHPHLLRHTYALELLDETKDIRLVSQALGHSDVRVTMRYTEREDEAIAEALERRRKK